MILTFTLASVDIRFIFMSSFYFYRISFGSSSVRKLSKKGLFFNYRSVVFAGIAYVLMKTGCALRADNHILKTRPTLNRYQHLRF